VKRAVFLDRDGVLNQAIIRDNKPYAPITIQELIINPEAYSALSKLKKLGFLLIGVTNQPDVPRGKAQRQDVELINQTLLQALPLDAIHVCYHDDEDDCACRKPKPGLIHQAAHDYSIDLSSSFMIGDRWKDIEAGKAACCQSIWLKNNYAEPQPKTMDFTAEGLMNAVEWIINKE